MDSQNCQIEAAMFRPSLAWAWIHSDSYISCSLHRRLGSFVRLHFISFFSSFDKKDGI